MPEPSIDKEFGRQAFGNDPADYHAARPAYPEWVFQELRDRCGLADGVATFEIGAGTGTATRRLLDLGADPLFAIEPDSRLATFLRGTNPDDELEVIVSPFEETALGKSEFDLGVSATAFHWLDEGLALKKIAGLLRPGGWWAMFWNVFGDDSRPDPFHDATTTLLNGASSPSMGTRKMPFALDAQSRVAALERTGAFEAVRHRTSAWSLALDAEQTVALYRTYSDINIRPDRESVFNEIGRIARDQFHGRVIRNMVTSLYIAQRRS